VLLVGHEPYLSQLISHLLTGGPDCQITMKKAGLCLLTIESLRDDRRATLEWLLTPRQMARMR
jgi:phosphohistidine phosphatase